jgi:mRNA interferase MazF
VVTAASWVPDRGDLVWLTFRPGAGHEQSGRRPALVLSPVAYNSAVGLAICCPVTTQVKGYPFEVTVPKNLPVAGVILSDHLKSLDWRERRAVFACRLPGEIVADVLSRLVTLLGQPV